MGVSRRDVIAVDPGLLKTYMLDDLYARVEARAPRPLPAAVEQLLAKGGPEHGDVVRAGYLTRIVETERFEPARRPMPWLAELLADRHGDAHAVAAELAESEPAGKPAPGDAAARAWQVPGPGGHVRWFLAARWSGGDEQRRRAWLYGFFLRCCEEARPELSKDGTRFRL